MIRFRDDFLYQNIRKAGSTQMLEPTSNFETPDEIQDQTHQEGPLAKAIEQQTARLPSDTWLWAATGAIAGSAILHAFDRKSAGQFVGQLAPVFLILGLYNKIVKLAGSDPIQF